MGIRIKGDVLSLKTLTDGSPATSELPGLPAFDMQIRPGSLGSGQVCVCELNILMGHSNEGSITEGIISGPTAMLFQVALNRRSSAVVPKLIRSVAPVTPTGVSCNAMQPLLPGSLGQDFMKPYTILVKPHGILVRSHTILVHYSTKIMYDLQAKKGQVAPL